MKRKQLFFDVLITFFASIIVGMIVSIGTYFWTVQGLNFEIGFPKIYYTQFYKDFLHHGFDVNHFIFNPLNLLAKMINL